jgi:hypothetical protein
VAQLKIKWRNYFGTVDEFYFRFTLLVQMTLPRSLTDEERRLTKWMIEHGTGDTAKFLSQLESAQVCGVCPCGCASIDFKIEGHSEKSKSGISPFADFIYGNDETGLYGAFVFSQDGWLAGLEVYQLSGEKPAPLPKPEELRSFENSERR